MSEQPNHDLRKLVAERLRIARERAGFTDRKAAHDALGLGTTDILGAWERGQYLPGTENLISICKCYGVSADWILGLSEAPSVKGVGGVIDLAVERAVLAAKSADDLDRSVKQLRATPDAGILWGYPVPTDFEVVDEKEWLARRAALQMKLDRLKKVRPWQRGRKSDAGDPEAK